MATNNSNKSANANEIIKGVMTNARDDSHRQSKLIKFLFDNPAEFGLDFTSKYHAADSKGKIPFVDVLLCRISDDYERIYNKHRAAADPENNKTKEDKAKNGPIVEGCLVQMRPVREMMKRALISLHWLRVTKASALVVRQDGRLNATHLEYSKKDGAITFGKEEVAVTLTGRDLRARGDEFRNIERRKAGSSNGNGGKAEAAKQEGLTLINSADLIVRSIRRAAEVAKEKGNHAAGIAHFGGDAPKALDSVLLELIKFEFADDKGNIHLDRIREVLLEAGLTVDGKRREGMTAKQAENMPPKHAPQPAKQPEKTAEKVAEKHPAAAPAKPAAQKAAPRNGRKTGKR